MRSVLLTLFLLPLLAGCSRAPNLVPQSYDPPGATDTRDKEIALQPRSVFSFPEEDVFISNNFPGGRLLHVKKTAPGAYLGSIAPENEPINNSAWYAFSAWSSQQQTIRLTLEYTGGTHRYWPKWSTDKPPLDPIGIAPY